MADDMRDRIRKVAGDSATLSVRQASQLLGVGLQLVYQAIENGEIPVLKLAPNRWRVPCIAIERILLDGIGKERKGRPHPARTGS